MSAPETPPINCPWAILDYAQPEVRERAFLMIKEVCENYDIDGIDIDIASQSTVGLVGESGCGKSVTALSILRLVPTPPGKIVDGKIVFGGQNLLQVTLIYR